ncbi:hypothetical protein E1292_43005 [Nonomuraea deserti]|uniref:Uncharacterized protein n=1 Tax=Nonomuraea deserti TaxID=1848322 RepID=A0A4R4UPM8_9ACTN|nr:hypothetical protein [Nonomuraea deserti]TDC91034.1 hypothetical protein E1292_43005 [Nonomuraea deserti]
MPSPDQLNAAANLSPRERSAFKSLIGELNDAGIAAEFIGSPEGQPEKYPPGLTVDGHLRIDFQDYYVDHTILPLPHSAILPAAMSEIEERLFCALEKVRELHASDGFVVTVVPQVNKKDKTRRRYYKKVLAIAFLAAALNRNVSSRELWGDGDDDWTSTEIYDFRNEDRQVVFAYRNPLTLSYSIADSTWLAEQGALGPVAEAIRKKSGNQLMRAKALGIQVALLVDARRSPDPKEPVLWFVDTAAAAAMMNDISASYPGVIARAWLLRDNERAVPIFPHTTRLLS